MIRSPLSALRVDGLASMRSRQRLGELAGASISGSSIFPEPQPSVFMRNGLRRRTAPACVHVERGARVLPTRRAVRHGARAAPRLGWWRPARAAFRRSSSSRNQLPRLPTGGSSRSARCRRVRRPPREAVMLTGRTSHRRVSFVRPLVTVSPRLDRYRDVEAPDVGPTTCSSRAANSVCAGLTSR
jgi:hypothetical protein